MTTCSFCGRQLPQGAAFCDACGGRIENRNEAQPSQPSGHPPPSQVFPDIAPNQPNQTPLGQWQTPQNPGSPQGQHNNQWQQGQNQWNAPPPGYNPWGTPPPPPPAKQNNTGTIFAVIALLCGLFAFLMPLPIVDIILGVAAFVFYGIALKFGQKQGCLMAAVIVFAILGILSAIGFNLMYFGIIENPWDSLFSFIR